jgi:hypothetical protein
VNTVIGLGLLAAMVLGYLALQWIAKFLSDASSAGLDKLVRPERRRHELALAQSEIVFSVPCTAAELFDTIVSAVDAQPERPARGFAFVVTKRTERMLQIDHGSKRINHFISAVRIAGEAEPCEGRFAFEHWKVEDNGRPRNADLMQDLRDAVQRTIEHLGGDARIEETQRDIKRKRPLV